MMMVIMLIKAALQPIVMIMILIRRNGRRASCMVDTNRSK